MDGLAVDELVLEVIDFGEFRKTKVGVVLPAFCRDDTGEVEVSLWGTEGDHFRIGDKIRIVDGWAKRYLDKMQVSSGKYGKIEKVGNVLEDAASQKGQTKLI